MVLQVSVVGLLAIHGLLARHCAGLLRPMKPLWVRQLIGSMKASTRYEDSISRLRFWTCTMPFLAMK